MVTYPKKVSITGAEEAVGWVLDFISKSIQDEDIASKWKLSAEAHKYLRLWDISSKDGTLYNEPPRLDLRALQMELSSAFETYLKPLLAGEKKQTDALSVADNLPTKVFTNSDGVLFCNRLLGGNIEKIGVANFLEALSFLTPISTNRFQKCEGCGRWFFPRGKGVRKARRFCSRTCNLRITARRQRERLRNVAPKKPDRAEKALARKVMKNVRLVPNVKVGRKGK